MYWPEGEMRFLLYTDYILNCSITSRSLVCCLEKREEANAIRFAALWKTGGKMTRKNTKEMGHIKIDRPRKKFFQRNQILFSKLRFSQNRSNKKGLDP
jgi:hypothetical protein